MLGSRRHHDTRQASQLASTTEIIQYNGKTFNVPLLPPTSGGTVSGLMLMPPEDKIEYFSETLEAIRNVSADGITKLSVLETRFPCPAEVTTIDGELGTLYNYNYGPDQQLVLHTLPVNVVQFSAPALKKSNNAELAPLPVGNINMSRNQRRLGQYYVFSVSINLSNAYQGPIIIRDKAKLKTFSLRIAVQLPTILIQDPLHQDNGHEVIDPSLTAAVLRSPRAALTQITVLQNGQPPLLGTMAKAHGAVEPTLSTTSLMALFFSDFQLARFQLASEKYRENFIGSAVVDSAYITQKITLCRQTYYNKDTNRMVTRTVNEFVAEITRYLKMYKVKYPIEPTMLIMTGIDTHIKEMSSATQPPFVLPPIPNNETNFQTDARVQTVKNALMGFEKQAAAMRSIAQQTTGHRQQAPPVGLDRGDTFDALAYSSPQQELSTYEFFGGQPRHGDTGGPTPEEHHQYGDWGSTAAPHWGNTSAGYGDTRGPTPEGHHQYGDWGSTATPHWGNTSAPAWEGTATPAAAYHYPAPAPPSKKRKTSSDQS
jgi:hypothetical protein